MVESPRERHGVPPLALSMISTAVVFTLVLSLSCTQKRPFEPDNPVIGTGADSLAFTAIAGGATPRAQSIPISNNGGGTLNFTATRRSDWLVIFYRGTAPDTIEVFAYALGLTSGVHLDTIFVRSSDATNSPVKIPVSLTVLPGISIKPDTVIRSAYHNGPAIPPETLRVVSEGGGPKIYRIEPVPGWLEVGYPIGLATEKLIVNFRTDAVPQGAFSHKLVISSSEAANVSAVAFCSLKVEAWRPRLSVQHIVLTSVAFMSSRTGWAGGYQRAFDGLEGVLFKTDDSGVTWRSVGVQHFGAISRVVLVDNDQLWLPTDTGTLITMADGRTQVRSLGIKERLTDLAFVTPDTGWVSGEGGVLFRSTDNGDTWVRQVSRTTQSLNALAFVDSRTGWAVGAKGTMVATSDGGDTWQAAVPGPEVDLHDIVVSPSGAIWVVGSGGTILCGGWSGVKWTEIPSGVTDDLQEIAFSSAEIGWIVGSRGAILRTSDGGVTWHRQASETDQTLFGVFPVDSARVFVTGNDALILDTYSGGE